MKHYSPAALERAARSWVRLSGENDLLALVRARLDRAGGKSRLANELGITETKLSKILRGQYTIDDQVARALGYRKVSRFERVS